MKMMKKLATLLLTICLIFPCFATNVEAAEGITFYTDLETKVGEKFNVDANVVVKGGVLGEATVKLSYDTEYVRFLNGEGVIDDGNGNLTLTTKGDGRSDRTVVKLEFQALKEGNTKITQVSESLKDASGKKVECKRGYSAVTIGEGDSSLIEKPGKSASVKIDGNQYRISEAFTEVSIPSGFEAGEMSYEDENYKCAVNEDSKLKAVYLLDDNNEGKFWLYDEKENEFLPLEEISISDISSIIILDGSDKIKLPVNYQESKININGNDFPVWIDTQKDGIYIFYALSTDGETSLYSYDSAEHTYQRMATPKKSDTKVTETKIDKMTKFVIDHFVWVLVGVSCVIILLAVFLIVVSVKLYHRNVELDDLYDEYGIDVEDKKPEVKTQKKNKKTAKVKEDTFIDWDDDYDDDYDDEYDDQYDDFIDLKDDSSVGADETSDKYDAGDDLAELRLDYESSPSKKTYDQYYDDDDFDDLPIEDLGVNSKDKSKKKSSKDDTFEIDFIDLD